MIERELAVVVARADRVDEMVFTAQRNELAKVKKVLLPNVHHAIKLLEKCNNTMLYLGSGMG